MSERVKPSMYVALVRTLKMSMLFGFSALVILSIISFIDFMQNPAESVLFNAYLDPIFWSQTIVSLGLLGGVLYGFTVGPIRLLSTRISTSLKGIAISEGVFKSRRTVYAFDTVDSVGVHQNKLEKMFDVSEVYITTTDDNTELFLIPQHEARSFADALQMQVANGV